MNALTKAAQDVLAERERQRNKWGDGHDDEHTNETLAYGSVSYLLPGQKPTPSDWAYKSKVIDREPRRDQLVKGAALALAALEHFDRAHDGDGTPEQEVFCEAHCCWSGHHKDCFRANPPSSAAELVMSEARRWLLGEIGDVAFRGYIEGVIDFAPAGVEASDKPVTESRDG
jgi:hypothetical protein